MRAEFITHISHSVMAEESQFEHFCFDAKLRWKKILKKEPDAK